MDIVQQVEQLRREIERLSARETPRYWALDTPLSSTDWSADTFSTAGKTALDLSVVFGAPAGIKAAIFNIWIKDSASSGGDYWICLDRADTAGVGIYVNCDKVDAQYNRQQITVTCNATGDVYYQIAASGAGTVTIIMTIVGYWL